MENKFNIYPNLNVDETSSSSQQNQLGNQQNQSDNSIIQKILPMLLSGKTLQDILPSLSNFSNFSNLNPMLANILSSSNNKTQNDNKKIESDKIDLSHLTKIE